MFLKQFYIKICKISSTIIRNVLYVLNKSAVLRSVENTCNCTEIHSVEIMEIYRHTSLAKIS